MEADGYGAFLRDSLKRAQACLAHAKADHELAKARLALYEAQTKAIKEDAVIGSVAFHKAALRQAQLLEDVNRLEAQERRAWDAYQRRTA